MWIFIFLLTRLVSAETTTTTTLEKSELLCGTHVVMGTEFKACLYTSSSQKLSASQDIQQAFKRLHEIDGWMSDWLPDTQLNQINQTAGIKPVKVSKELFDLLVFSQKVSQSTHGAYDPTFNVFFGLYNFKKGQEREPTDAEIKERQPLINYKDLVLDNKTQTAFLKRSGMKIGLGAIGQSYGVDEVAKILKQKYASGYIDGSGDTLFWGKKPDNTLWTTGVRSPINHEKILAKIYGTDFSVTTSGDDEKFFMIGNRRVHHIIDPRTGRPSTKLRQITVISTRGALLADAYDTSCMVLGAKECLKVLKAENLEGFLVQPNGKLIITEGIVKKKDKWGDYYILRDSN